MVEAGAEDSKQGIPGSENGDLEMGGRSGTAGTTAELLSSAAFSSEHLFLARVRSINSVPSLRHQRKIVLVSCVFVTLLLHNFISSYGGFYFYYEDFQDALSLDSVTLVNLTIIAFLVFSTLFALAFGPISLRYINARTFVIIETFLQAVFVLLFALCVLIPKGQSQSMAALLFRCLSGAASGLALSSCLTMLCKMFSKYDGSILSAYILFTGLATLSGSYLGDGLYKAFDDVAAPSYFFSALSLTVAVILTFMLPEMERLDRMAKVKTSKVATYVDILLEQGVLISLITIFASFTVLSFFSFQLDGYVSKIIPDFQFKSLVFAGTVLAFIIIAPIAGILVDKCGTRLPSFLGLVLAIFSSALLVGASRDDLTQGGAIVSSKRNLVFTGIVFEGAAMALTIGPSLPDVMRAVRKIGYGSHEIAAGLVTSSVSVGQLVGFLINAIFPDSEQKSFSQGCTVIVIVFACLLLWFFIDAAIRYYIKKENAKRILGGGMIEEEEELPIRDAITLEAFRERIGEMGGKDRETKEDLPEEVTFELKDPSEYSKEQLKSMKEKYEAAVMELQSTELSYLRQLKLLLKKYRDPFKELKKKTSGFPITIEEIDSLFKDVETIINLHELFYEEITSETANVVGIFEKFLHYFKLYIDYVNKYDGILQLLSKKKNDKAFRKQLARIQNNNEGLAEALDIPLSDFENMKGQTLESLLILPIQRIPRYILLLKEINKNTPKIPDMAEEISKLNSITEQVNSMCNFINSSDASRKNLLKILQIQDEIQEGHFFTLPQSLVQPHRKYARDGPLIRRTGGLFRDRKAIHAYLFNDIFVWTSKQKRFKGLIDLTGACILPVSESDIKVAAENEIDRSFHLVPASKDAPLTLVFESLDSKREWEIALLDVIANLERTIKGLAVNERNLEILSELAATADKTDLLELMKSDVKFLEKKVIGIESKAEKERALEKSKKSILASSTDHTSRKVRAASMAAEEEKALGSPRSHDLGSPKSEDEPRSETEDIPGVTTVVVQPELIFHSPGEKKPATFDESPNILLGGVWGDEPEKAAMGADRSDDLAEVTVSPISSPRGIPSASPVLSPATSPPPPPDSSDNVEESE